MKRIKSIKVIGSPFFEEGLSISFSEKLNCLMGGRGTGKSTILFFIQAALNTEAEEDSMTLSILKANLLNGKIQLQLEDEEGTSYEITKTLGDEPLVSTKSKSTTSIESMQESLECDIYPALRIERIGLSSEDRLELIDKRIRTTIRTIKSEIRQIQIALTQNAHSIRTENAKRLLAAEQITNYGNPETEFSSHKKGKPDDINKADEDEFERADKSEKLRSSEKRYGKQVMDKLIEISDSLQTINDDMQSFLSLNSDTKGLVNHETISRIKLELETVLNKTMKDNELNIGAIRKAGLSIGRTLEELATLHQSQQSEFIKLKQKFDKHKEYINKYNLLSKKVEEKGVIQKDLQAIDARTNKIRDQRKLLITQLEVKKKEIYEYRRKIVEGLNADLNGLIKITLTYGGITEEYETRLRNALRGSYLRYNVIIPYIVQNLAPSKLAEIVHNKDFVSLQKIAQIDEERSKAVIGALSESEDVYEIEAMYCEDLPDFYLKVDAKDESAKKDKEHFKRTDELSTGQRCTTVLPIIFAVSNNPLLIDQPEDNLDNKYITEAIHRIIRDQKEKRQLIFITHNPNIPVLSNSEFNVFLSYQDKKAKVDVYGPIPSVKDSILNLLEGGKEAFKLRRALYGE